MKEGFLLATKILYVSSTTKLPFSAKQERKYCIR